jgi:hypothetical protein
MVMQDGLLLLRELDVRVHVRGVVEYRAGIGERRSPSISSAPASGTMVSELRRRPRLTPAQAGRLVSLSR